MGGTSVFFGLFNNLAVFIIMVAAYGVLDEWLQKRGRIRRQVVIGAVFGLFIYVCMHVRIPVAALPVILCTGYGSPVSEEEAMAAGVRKICMKPARKTELGQVILRVLDGSASLRGGPASQPLPPGT
jgi:hypothetical protein